MKPLNLYGFAALLLGLASQAFAELPKDSPLRVTDCVPFDGASRDRLKALREKVRAAFARHGGPRDETLWADQWNAALGLADDWTPIVGDGGVVGLDSPSLRMAAMIPRGWTQPASAAKPGAFDPVALVEAAGQTASAWSADAVSSAVFFHPSHWDVRISSQADIAEGQRVMARFYFHGSRPELWVNVSALPSRPEDPRWFESTVGEAVLQGHAIVGSGTMSIYGRHCRVSYLEREGWKDPATGEPSFVWKTVVGCGPAEHFGSAGDLLAVFETAEYKKAGAPDAEVLAAYDAARRSFCTVNMPVVPLKP